MCMSCSYHSGERESGEGKKEYILAQDENIHKIEFSALPQNGQIFITDFDF